jgi:uncharacterized protein YcbK (DUF882 family)
VRRLSLHNLHTGERLTTVYWERGAYVPAAFEEISTILRDHRTGEVRQMAPGLIDLAHELTACLGVAQPVQIVSGYRSPATNALLHAGDPDKVANSLHLTAGPICARRSPCVPCTPRRSRCTGGVGYYPRTAHPRRHRAPPPATPAFQRPVTR